MIVRASQRDQPIASKANRHKIVSSSSSSASASATSTCAASMDTSDLQHAAQLFLSLAQRNVERHTLAEAIERYQLEHLYVDGLSQRTIAWRELTCRRLLERFGQRDVAGRWRDAAGRLYQEFGDAAGSLCVNTLSRLLNLARDEWKWRHDGHDLKGLCRVRSEHRSRIVRVDKRRALFEALEQFTSPRQHVAAEVCRFVIWSGWRVSEGCAIEWADVSPDGSVYLPETKAGEQLRALGPQAMAVLERQPTRGASKCVFPNRRGDRHIDRRQPEEIMRRACDSIGLDYASLHTLRHTRATDGAELQLPSRNVALALGHTVEWQTAQYQHVELDAVRETAARIDARTLDAIGGVPCT